LPSELNLNCFWNGRAGVVQRMPDNGVDTIAADDGGEA
jgi:hypothetical protein